MNPKILIGKWGKIIAGDEIGRYVFVEDDSTGSTGGFYVFTSPEPSLKKGFDDWVKDINDLEKYFGEAGWQIQWSNSEGDFSE